MAPRRRVFDEFPHNRKWRIRIDDGKYVVYAPETHEAYAFDNYNDVTAFIYADVRGTYPWKFRG